MVAIEFISSWIYNIIIFLLLAMVIEMLLPENDMKKYAKLVTGLLLITIIISPILKVFTIDFEKLISSVNNHFQMNDYNTSLLIERKKNEIQASQHAYTLEQMAVQMKNQVEKELIENHQVKIERIQLTADPNGNSIEEFLKKIIVHMTPTNDKTITIEPVIINVSDEPQTKRNEETELKQNELLEYLSEMWDIPENIIEIVLREDQT